MADVWIGSQAFGSVLVLDRKLASVAIKMFSHLNYFCAFNVIYKGDAAINYMSVQHRQGSFPSNLKGLSVLG